ncbi:DEAD/DEAH box helicase [Nocardia cyriacigeorgica]|uniref:DEAD/DEAH box helicase n=1 Tax=Nocardia cyriacigeorgica TaxID=135487 RepID=UPI002493AE8A|nr:DEAD/DEAH box helicase [Nocardia cyriacigeorgica]
MALIAQIEIAAMMNRFEIDEKILQTAWYLHGICALTEAAELYTPTRQRRAFAVSAHIFDLAVNGRSQSPSTLLSLAFAAQVGYRRAGQEPNATALFGRISYLCHGPEPVGGANEDTLAPTTVRDYIETLALEAGTVFLSLQTATIRRMVRHWRAQLADVASQLESANLHGTIFGPAAAVVNAIGSMVDFLTYGRRSQLASANAALQTVLNGEAGEGDLNARWVAAHLLDLGDELAHASLHDMLPPTTPRAVAQAFTLTNPPVLTLWPPQRELLTRPTMNPLDPATGQLLISIPTSAGKSLVSQLIMCTHLATVPGRVIYVSPLRSLSREMRRSMRGRLRILDRELGADSPDFPILNVFSEPESEEADVDIVTPERLMHALRHDPETALSDVTLIIVDEAHHIAQDRRGFLLEGLLAFCQTHPSSPRLVLLSAAIGNGATIARWLNPNSSEVLFNSNWRGPRRLHGLLTTDPMWDKRTTVQRKSAARPLTTSVPMAVRISIRPAQSVNVTELTTSRDEPLGELVFAQRDINDWSYRDKRSTAAYKMFAQAATYFLPAGPMLVVTSTHRLAQDTASAMAVHLPEHEPASRLAEQFRAQLGAEHPLVDCTRRGIAFHHAALPTDVLEAIENALRNDHIRAVVSTTTLTDGVNLPVRTVVITAALSNEQRAQSNGVPGIDAAKLLNAVGRAGRAGRESEGWILLALNRRIDPKDHDIFSPTEQDLQVNSALTREQAINDLAEAEQLIADSADGILAVTQPLVCDFITYVWFVLDAHENLRLEANALESVDRLLAMQQLPEDIKDRWRRLAAQTQQRYLATSPAVRRRWTTTGTSLKSAEALDYAAARVVNRLIREEPTQMVQSSVADPVVLSLADTLRLLDEEEAFDVILGLPEGGTVWSFYDRRAGRRNNIEVDLQLATRTWVDGHPIPVLARRWLPTIPIDWALEQAVANISKTFEHYLSWTVGALVYLINDRLSKANSSQRLRADTAWCLRYGVDTAQAIHLLTSGIHSRTLAHVIGRNADSHGISSGELREWLASQHITTWRQLYQPTDLEVEDLTEYVRVRGRSLLRGLLTDDSIALDVEARSSSSYPTVRLLWPEHGPTHEIEVVDDQATIVARVRAGDHADLISILRSGVPISLQLDGNRLSISRLDNV